MLSIRQLTAHYGAAQALFGRGELQELSAHTLDGVVREVKGAEVAGDVTIVDALVAAGLVDSKGAARRAVAEGGAYLNNEKVTDPELLLTGELLLHGRYAILRRGRKTVGAVVRG